MIFGGENRVSTKDIDNTYLFNVDDLRVSCGPNLPEKILPENPGYNINSHACFYFLGNIGNVFRFNKS